MYRVIKSTLPTGFCRLLVNVSTIATDVACKRLDAFYRRCDRQGRICSIHGNRRGYVIYYSKFRDPARKGKEFNDYCI